MKTFTLLFAASVLAILFSTSCMNNSSTSSAGRDTLAQNKALATRMENAFSAGDSVVVDSTMTANAIDHQMFNMPGTTSQKVNAAMRMFKAAFPDGKTEIKAMTAEGNLVSVFGTFSGTNTGSFMGMSATNKKMSMDFADVFRIENGKATEHWGVMDMSPMMMEADSSKMMKKEKMK